MLGCDLLLTMTQKEMSDEARIRKYKTKLFSGMGAMDMKLNRGGA